MSNVINTELRELRMTKEHYQKILKEDKYIKENGGIENYLLLSDEDIAKINTKIEIISMEIEKLLKLEKDYVEVQ